MLFRSRVYLLLEHLFNLADFLLDFAGEVFVLTFGHQVGVVRGLSRFLFDFTFYFMDVALDLIRRARFHMYSPLYFPARFVNHLLPLQSGTQSSAGGAFSAGIRNRLVWTGPGAPEFGPLCSSDLQHLPDRRQDLHITTCGSLRFPPCVRIHRLWAPTCTAQDREA